MSNQEMQFADPDWEPTRPAQKQTGTQQPPVYTPQPVNDDIRERTQQPIIETPSEQEEVYGGLPPYAGTISPPRQAPYQYQRMPNRRRRRGAWLWIIIAILIFSLLSGGWNILGNIGQSSLTQEHPFNVSGTPTIVIHETDGNIHVRQGGSLDIETVKQGNLFYDPSKIQVNFKSTGSVINVSVDSGSNFLSSGSVDFNITVPGNANLDLQTSSGDISVNDTTGQMTLATDSGNISASNDTLSNVQLSSSSGDIDSRGDTFSGQANITTSSGDVSMDGDALNGPTKVNSSSGDIDFNGSVASSGSYQFGSDSGDISIRLPSNANLQVQATTSSGSIDSGDFPTIIEQDYNQGSGSQASGSVGTAPRASLTITTHSGDITLHQSS